MIVVSFVLFFSKEKGQEKQDKNTFKLYDLYDRIVKMTRKPGGN